MLNQILHNLRQATEQQLACFEQLAALPEIALLEKVEDVAVFRERMKSLRAHKSAELALLDQLLSKVTG